MPPGRQTFNSPGFFPTVPQYVQAPPLPAPKRRRPVQLVVLGTLLIAIVALLGLIIASLSSTTTDVAYQNDDYTAPAPDTNPPPIPLPQTYEEAQQWIEANPFYEQTTPVPVRCGSPPINVTTADDAQLKSHFEGLMECLMRVWDPPATRAGFQLVRPTVTIYSDKMTTKCGTSGVNAFYCAADQQVYYSNQLPRALGQVGANKWTADVVMAHEFGHALQGRTGILVSAHALGQQSGDEATDLLFSRRLETQADCLSGMFVRAVSLSLGVQPQDEDGILAIYIAIGDDTLSGEPQIVGNHGLARSRKYWGTLGLTTSDIGRCNTFVVPAGQVR